LQALRQRLTLAVIERAGGHHLGHDLAAPARKLREIGVDHRIEGEETALTRDDAHEPAREIAHPGASHDLGNGAALRLAANERAANHLRQIRAPRQQPLDATQIIGDRIERPGPIGKIIQSSGVPLGDAADHPDIARHSDTLL